MIGSLICHCCLRDFVTTWPCRLEPKYDLCSTGLSQWHWQPYMAPPYLILNYSSPKGALQSRLVPIRQIFGAKCRHLLVLLGRSWADGLFVTSPSSLVFWSSKIHSALTNWCHGCRLLSCLLCGQLFGMELWHRTRILRQWMQHFTLSRCLLARQFWVWATFTVDGLLMEMKTTRSPETNGQGHLFSIATWHFFLPDGMNFALHSRGDNNFVVDYCTIVL